MPDEFDAIRRRLRKALTTLYADPVSAKRVVDDAGLDSSQIRFDLAIGDVWHNILLNAENHERLEELLTIARSEYPGNSLLKSAYVAYQESVEKLALAEPPPHETSTQNNSGASTGAENVDTTETDKFAEPLQPADTGFHLREETAPPVHQGGMNLLSALDGRHIAFLGSLLILITAIIVTSLFDKRFASILIGIVGLGLVWLARSIYLPAGYGNTRLRMYVLGICSAVVIADVSAPLWLRAIIAVLPVLEQLLPDNVQQTNFLPIFSTARYIYFFLFALVVVVFLTTKPPPNDSPSPSVSTDSKVVASIAMVSALAIVAVTIVALALIASPGFPPSDPDGAETNPDVPREVVNLPGTISPFTETVTPTESISPVSSTTLLPSITVTSTVTVTPSVTVTPVVGIAAATEIPIEPTRCYIGSTQPLAVATSNTYTLSNAAVAVDSQPITSSSYKLSGAVRPVTVEEPATSQSYRLIPGFWCEKTEEVQP